MFPKSKKNSFSLAVQNNDFNRSAEGLANKRKFS